MKLNGIEAMLIPEAGNAVGLAESGRCPGKTWIRLEKTSGRPGYRQRGSCNPVDAKLLEKLHQAGRLKVAPIPGLGCSVVTLHSRKV